MERVFLDANVLFSAAWRSDAGLHGLWSLTGVELITSEYARDEAFRNLENAARRDRLQKLLSSVRILGDVSPDLPLSVSLDVKDQPILRAAMQVGATHLLTGDRNHFGHLLGRTVSGVLILLPATYLRGRGSK